MNVLNMIRAFIKNGLGTPVLLVMMLMMLIVPIPPFGLDVLFTFNITLSLIVILVTIYTMRPLDFAVFPTVLLIATMMRLGLNVASTRVVLIEGHTGSDAAGSVIQSFGDFVIGGNYAVGIVVFAILIIINFVVVTKGAGRVSEVSARFTLDAMPGKQMAIDADLNAGLIDQHQAKARREDISNEADFYGSMDGASKFVRGDAIAGILIVFINIAGGLIIGMTQHGLSLEVATQNYLLLTVGDGLVAQIPSLLLSTATAIIVTRVSSSQDMSKHVITQMFDDKRALGVSAAIIGGLGLIPGMPNVAFLTLGAIAGGAAYWMKIDKSKQVASEVEDVEPPAPSEENADISWDDMQSVDKIGLEVGYKLIPLVDRKQNGQLMGRIKGVRKKLSQELGFLIQPVHIRDNLDLNPNSYRITLLGVNEGEGEIYPDRELAINPGSTTSELKGIKTTDPAFGMDATWIEANQKDYAQSNGYTVVDPATVIATHINKILRDHASAMLGYDEVQMLLDNLGEKSPKLVEDLVPKALPIGTITKVLQNLLQEGVSIRDIRTISETLLDAANTSQDADVLTSTVRVALRRMIVQGINGMRSELSVFTIDTKLEQLLQKSVQGNNDGYLMIEPGLAEKLQKGVRESAQKLQAIGLPAVLVVSKGLRTMLSRLFSNTVTDLHVIAYEEIPESKQIKIVANVGEETEETTPNMIGVTA
ncbi:MAG: flagellar biosynthesis protein FlhA [Gammaproteobacteria bacterium]